MIDENTIRREITQLMAKVPTFFDKQNTTHMTAFGYVRECLRVYRKCISINFLDDISMEALSIDYYSYLNCIYATDKVLFPFCIKYLHIILDNLMNILEKNELYESARNLMWVMEIIEDSIDQELKKQKTKNKK